MASQVRKSGYIVYLSYFISCLFVCFFFRFLVSILFCFDKRTCQPKFDAGELAQSFLILPVPVKVKLTLLMFFLSWLSIALLVNFFEVQNVMDLLWDQSAANHYDFNTDKVCNSLRIPVLIDTCAMRR